MFCFGVGFFFFFGGGVCLGCFLGGCRGGWGEGGVKPSVLFGFNAELVTVFLSRVSYCVFTPS